MSAVRATLKQLHSPDVFDLEAYSPDDETCFGFLLQAMFGPENADGEESFNMIVCTPKWLAGELAQRRIISGRHHVIVNEYNFEELRSFLTAYGSKCEGDTWQEVALKLSRIGRWEFEDYVP